MRRSFFAFTAPMAVLAAALAVSACQPPSEPPADPAPAVTAEVPAAAAPTPDPAPGPAPIQTPAPTLPPAETAPSPQPVPVADPSCRDQIGAAASAALVQRCIQVSPATRPPCNAANPCEMIQGEIDRSCAMWERDGNPPAECRT